jgi:hypothetical protein
MTRHRIPYRLSRAHSAPKTRHLPLVRHFWRTSWRLLPARFVVARRDGYGLRKVRRAWSVLGLVVRRGKETAR